MFRFTITVRSSARNGQKGSMSTVSNSSHGHTGNETNENVTPAGSVKRRISRSKPLRGAYISLLLFMVIYCARPGDWIPGLSGVPLAKIAGVIALLALIFSLRHIRRQLPREVFFLAILIGQLFLASAMSSVWRGGALGATFDFAKILLLVIVMSASVNTTERLRLLIFVQAASVAVIAVITVWKSHHIIGRLEGILGGNYSNPNDLALGIVISLPLCLALLFLSRNWVWKVVWAIAMLVMSYAVFLTSSRGGFFALITTAAFCLWGYAVQGRRRYLLIFATLLGAILWQFSGGLLRGRLTGTLDSKDEVASSYESSKQRQELFWKTVEVTEQNPLFGVGPGNFVVISGNWHVSHNAFTQMSSEGGIPALIFYSLILWCGFRNVSITTRIARSQRILMLLARALRASLAGYVVGSLFASTAYQFFPYFLVAYTTALLWIAKKSSAQIPPERATDLLPEKEPIASTAETWESWLGFSIREV
jgi:putative inorganic carbon (HCO3(-)) transporter